MPFPGTIVAADQWPAHKNALVGPFQNGTNLYVVLVDKVGNKVRAYKSLDHGETWAEQHAASAPASSTVATHKSITVHQSGTSLYVFNAVSTTSMNIQTFQMASDTWAAAIVGPTITLNTQISAQAVVEGVRRSDGSFVIFYNGATETVSTVARRRVKLHYRTAAGTWTGPYDVKGSANSPPANTLPATAINYDTQGCVLGDSDRVHVLFRDGVSTPNALVQRAFLSTNVFATATNGGSLLGTYAVGPVRRLVRSGVTQLALVLKSGATGNPTRAPIITEGESVALTTTANVTTVVSETTNSVPGVLEVDGSTHHAFWLDDAGQQINRTTSTDNGVNWAASVVWKAIICAGISAFYVSTTGTAIGVVYLEGTAVKYDRHVLTAGVIDPFPAAYRRGGSPATYLRM